MTSEECVKRLRIHLERCELGRVPGHDRKNIVGDLLGGGPVLIEPMLELSYLPPALDLDVQLDVLRESRPGEVARSNERLCADHVELGVSDVCLCVKLVLAVHATLDLAAPQGLHNSICTSKKGVGGLLVLKAGVETAGSGLDRLRKCLLGSKACLVTHEDSDLVKLLPAAFEG